MSLIRIEDLSRTYRLSGGAVHALRGVSLEVERGEFVAIMGPSGSGKSSLIYLIGLLDRATDGRYFLEGRDVTTIAADQQAALRNRRVGFVFQAFNLLPRSTALENVELPLVYAGVRKRDRRERAVAALTAVGLRNRLDHGPQQLSGGEQQRVAIARAVVTEPVLILADEPTGSLDTATGAEILALLGHLHKGGTTVMLVTHDSDVAGQAHRVVHMRDGRIISPTPLSETPPP